MGLFDFITKCRERREEKLLTAAKRGIALIEEVYNWVYETPDFREVSNRVGTVCVAAVLGDPGGIAQQGLDWTEAYWRLMMTEGSPRRG